MIRIHQQLADYARACIRLVWQRQLMFAGGTVLAALFTDPLIALGCYGLCLLAEWYDLRVCREVLDWRSRDGLHPARPMRRLMISSAATTIAIVIFVVAVAAAEGPKMHLGPLFFLFAAALYATMNACQVPQILRARLLIYFGAFVFIPVRDIIIVRPPLESELWMQLGTVPFFIFLLRECAVKFVSNYRSVQTRLDDLRFELDRVAEAYEVQSQFVSIVSHELRTPLTSIKASLDLISNEDIAVPVGEMRRLASIGRSNSNRLAALIDDLLDFQKLNSGKMVFRMERIDLGAMVADAMEANRGMADTRGVELALSLPPAPLYVRADMDRMMQVLANVLSNAIKFSHGGGKVDVTVRSHNGQLQVMVQDHGIGIPEEAREMVFAPFMQVDASDKRAHGGTGLGMSITKRIMEAHEGSIDYVSEPGRGTTFFIALNPLEETQADEAEDPYEELCQLEPVAT